MSFQPIQFVYNPPQTIDDGIPPSSASSVSADLSTEQIIANSNSSILINTLATLQQTNAFLQAQILAYTANTVIQIDPNIDVEMAAAAQAVYGQIPTGISTQMYSNLLDAQVTSQLLASQLNGTGNQLNGPQQSSVSTLITSVNNALLDNVSVNNQLTLLLGSLKTDQSAFQSLTTSLQTYPIQSLTSTSTNTNSSLDVSPALNTYLTSALSNYSSNYANAYNILGTTAVINSDSGTANAFTSQSVSDISAVVGLLTSASGLVYKDVFKDLVQDLSNFVYIRLIAEASLVVTQGDMLLQMSTNKLKNSGFSSLMSQVESLTQKTGTAPAGSSIGGLSKLSPCCGSTNVTNNLDTTLSAGLQEAFSQLNWLQSKVIAKVNQQLSQFKKIIGRRLGTQQSQINLINSLKSAEALVALAGSLVNQATGTQTVPLPSPAAANTLNSIVSAPPAVQTLLTNAGAQTTTSAPTVNQPTNVITGTVTPKTALA